MVEVSTSTIEREASQLVEAYLRRGLVRPGVAERAEQLHAEDRPVEALEVILTDRRDGATEATANGHTDGSRCVSD